VFVDIGDDYLMDLGKASEKISNRTKAIVYVHLFGQMGDTSKITQFAELNRLILIEDAAQTFGSSYGCTPGGATGLCSCLSFDPTKIVGAPGSGGIVLTDNIEIAETVRRLRYHGKGKDGLFTLQGYNSQMSSIVAAILNAKLGKFENWINRRRQIAGYYIENLGDSIGLPIELEGSRHNYHKFVIRLRSRNEVKQGLSINGIETMVHYEHLLIHHPMFARSADGKFPNAALASREVLSLPINSFLTDEEVEFIVKKTLAFDKPSSLRRTI
jgi:dTDP-4-amino-4,6-dideoxygalactose transaminase